MILRLIGLLLMIAGAGSFVVVAKWPVHARGRVPGKYRQFSQKIHGRWQIARPLGQTLRVAYAMALFLVGAVLLMGIRS